MLGACGSERVRRVRGQAKKRLYVLDGVNEDSVLLECGAVP
jgi:hypothetical protein